MQYIHEQPDWPVFHWDMMALAQPLSAVRLKQGRLLGRVAALGFGPPGLVLVNEPELTLHSITQDVLKSSEIEGELLPIDQVRSSVARRLGLSGVDIIPTGRNVEGIVAMLLDATQNYMRPLDTERLWSWHAALFPTGRSVLGRIQTGCWRDGPMRVVSGPMGKEHVHFEAPSPLRLASEMEQFLTWFNADKGMDPLLKAGLAQLWFLTIHPFEDGNGRIARALTDLLLARSEGSSQRFYSMSKRIQEERNTYYQQLEAAQRGKTDVTTWLIWFLGCLERAFVDAEATLDQVLVKARFWARHQERPLNHRQRQMLNRLLDGFEGKLNSSKWAAMTHVSQDTAARDLDELLQYGIVAQHAGGRSTHYTIILNG